MYKISEIVDKTGISEFNLRNWEKRFGFPIPQKESSGHRKYSQADLEALIAVSKHIESGKRISTLKELYLSVKSNCLSRSNIYSLEKISQVTEVLETLYSFNANNASKMLTNISISIPPVDMLELIYSPALLKIGNDWHAKKISIAQEHFASQFFRNKLFSFLDTQHSLTGKSRIAFATTTNERHEGGILLLTAGLTLNATKVLYLGCDIPLNDIIHTIENLRIKNLGLSYLSIINFERDIKTLNNLPIKIVVGGPGVNPQLIKSNNVVFINNNVTKTVTDIQRVI